MRVAGIERIIELGKKELVIADHAANTQQGIAQRRTVAFTFDLGMLREKLAQQSRTRSGQSGYTYEFWGHREVTLKIIIGLSIKQTWKTCLFARETQIKSVRCELVEP